MTGHAFGPSGLFTDLYELRMVESYLARGMTADATFSLFVRAAPERPWLVCAGAHRVLELFESFRYAAAELDYLRSIGVDEPTLDYLAGLRPSGETWAVEEGRVVLADEPILELTAPLPFAQLVETAVINLVQYPTLIATKAARVALAAAGRPVVDFGLRRAHGLETGVEAALAAYIGGGMATSNVEAGRRFGIPVVGTMAHSFVQAHTSELEAFRAFGQDHPDNTVLLVDTYDALEGVRNAITVADELASNGHRLRGIRLDSGDLAELSVRARELLDAAGLGSVEIFASGGLDEFDIAALADAPIDAFGVGTDLVTSADRPALDIAYKLVTYDGRPAAKKSVAKETLPGAKQVFRRASPADDVLGLRDEVLDGTPLLEPIWRDGSSLRPFSIEGARQRAADDLAALPEEWRRPEPHPSPPRPQTSEALRALRASVGAR